MKEGEARGLALVEKYFGARLTARQMERMAALGPLYAEWNARINVISRKDMADFYLRHVLHSLAIALYCDFGAGARVLDVGTGGGFPGIPLAIAFPEAHFTLCDSVGKKIAVVREVASALGLGNVEAVHGRAEELPGRYEWVVSRAVAPARTIMQWVWDKVEAPAGDAPHTATGGRGGIVLLKGGDELQGELAEAGGRFELRDIWERMPEEWLQSKKIAWRWK